MQKREHVGFVYFLAFTFLALAVFGGLGFYNSSNAVTGATAFKINPFGDLLSGFRSLSQNSEVMGYILVFIAIFPIIYLLVSRIHIFHGASNKWPGIIVATSITLISMIFVPSFTETIIGIFVYSTALTLLVVIFLLVWTAYSLLHKRVSEDVGEFANIATTRDQKRAEAMSAKGERISAKSKLKNLFGRNDKEKNSGSDDISGENEEIIKKDKPKEISIIKRYYTEMLRSNQYIINEFKKPNDQLNQKEIKRNIGKIGGLAKSIITTIKGSKLVNNPNASIIVNLSYQMNNNSIHLIDFLKDRISVPLEFNTLKMSYKAHVQLLLVKLSYSINNL